MIAVIAQFEMTFILEKGGAMHGQGSYTYQHLRGDRSSVYEGQWSEGQYEGRGKLTLYNGNVYDGEWRAKGVF